MPKLECRLESDAETVEGANDLGDGEKAQRLGIQILVLIRKQLISIYKKGLIAVMPVKNVQ